MHRTAAALIVLLTFAAAALGQAGFARTEVTSTDLVLNVISSSDTEETDFFAVDIDLDGDLDCLVGRKSPFTTNGPRANLLLMNDGTGILTDMTTTYTSFTSNLDNTRDIKAADYDNDGFPDVMVANIVGEPTRLYMNNGNDVTGAWQGLAAPINIALTDGSHNHCGVDAFDYDGDGKMDMYRGDYNSSNEDSLLRQDPSNPLSFVDMSSTLPSGFASAGFRTTVITMDPYGNFLDYNNDGNPDIYVNSASIVNVAYGDGMGGWITSQSLAASATYSSCVGDYDQDGRIDGFKQGDSTDHWNRNISTLAGGTIDEGIDESVPDSGGLGGNATTVDFDGDGLDDVIVYPVDVDIQNCGPGNETKIFRNTGTTPRFALASPTYPLSGFDGATADFDCDGLPDLLMSTCAGQGWYYYRSDPNNLAGACTPALTFYSAFLPVSSGAHFHVENVPQTSGFGVQLYNLFSLQPANPTGSGPFLGIGADAIVQLTSSAQPFTSFIGPTATTYDFVSPFSPPGGFSIDFVSAAVDLSAFTVDITGATNHTF